MGKGEKILSATIARLYTTEKDPGQWNYTGHMGISALVFDERVKTCAIRLYELTVCI